MLYRENINTYEKMSKVSRGLDKKKTQIISLQYILLCTLAFFSSRVVVLKALMPFGIAFFIASSIRLKRHQVISTAIISILGYLTMFTDYTSIAHAVVIALTLLMYIILNNRVKNKKLNIAIMAFIMNIGIGVFFRIKFISSEFLVYDFLIIMLESVLILGISYIFSCGIPVLFENERRRVLSKEEMIFITIMLSIIAAGIPDIKYMDFSIRNIVSFFIVLCTGYIEGAAMGAAFGVTLGIISGLSNPTMSMFPTLYAFCGLISGLFKDLGKLSCAIAFMISCLLISFYTSGITNVYSVFIESAIPGIVFMIIPERRYNKIAFLIDGDKRLIELQRSYIDRVRDIMGVKLSCVTNTLRGLSEILEKNIDNELSRKTEINGMVEKLADKVCQNCDCKNLCWKRELYYTYDAFIELLRTIEGGGRVEMADIPESLKKKCLRPNELAKQANVIFEIFRLNNRWKKKLINSKVIVADQIKGISGLVSNMIEEVTTTMEFKNDVEQEIAVALDRKGIEFDDIMAVKNSRNKYEVTIYKKPCHGNKLCNKEFVNVISKTLGVKMKRDSSKCKMNDECSMCQFRLIESEGYNIVTAVSKVAKEDISGDSLIFGEAGEGRYMMALSDGMGSGHRASIESDTTISLLEKFIHAGFERNTAIKAINSVLVLRSCDESYATIDLGLIDMYSGIGEFIKIGSAPTFVKSGSSVEVINSSSLPVGILDNIDIESQIVDFKNGDMIVMLSDGVVDSNDTKEKWVMKSLRECESGNPKEVADYLIERAKHYYGENINDDMTVIVSKIWKVM